MKIYLAGPDVFRADAQAHGMKLRAFCHSHGAEGLWPLDNEVKPFAPDRATAMKIFVGNIAYMDSADCAVANITPFRGPNMDPGTAFEIGYMYALGKPVFAYTSNGSALAARSVSGGEFPTVEDFGLTENLMIVGGTIRVYASAEDAILAAKNYLK
jgi:nucleoside 2-deoxyribosyltransferase